MRFRRLRKAGLEKMTKEVFSSFVDQYGDDVYAFCGYLTGNAHDRDDLFQDTFLLAIQKMDKIQNDGNIKSYFLSLSIGLWKNLVRKRKVRQFLTGETSLEEDETLQIPDKKIGTEDSIIQEEELSYLRKQISLLPDKQRIPIILYYLEELSQEQIAACMQLPVGTIKSRLCAGRKKLKERMEAAGYDR